ncbi:hypothetical protein LIPSTDRAFT_173097 [Lipomyces starkeyi NRRL Y-11557]|uniref:Uncharacterized protein n=1 Tax=Lipomyces starkeyi NRRL Y-11557 TaxID=675824 RepID=A0A1E3PX62_LIPST|nr:hypothetical protein LIPSTDRAFT_173097 [Lipomyces starkeyi NRRL Y-11557]
MQFSVEFPTLCNLSQLIRCFQVAKWQSGFKNRAKVLSSRTPYRTSNYFLRTLPVPPQLVPPV